MCVYACLWGLEPQDKNACQSEREQANVQVEQDQEGERKRAEKETEETERGGFELCGSKSCFLKKREVHRSIFSSGI